MMRREADKVTPLDRRLKGLDEFEPPEFVGRMGRAARRQRLALWALIAGGFAAGVGLGLTLF